MLAIEESSELAVWEIARLGEVWRVTASHPALSALSGFKFWAESRKLDVAVTIVAEELRTQTGGVGK